MKQVRIFGRGFYSSYDQITGKPITYHVSFNIYSGLCGESISTYNWRDIELTLNNSERITCEKCKESKEYLEWELKEIGLKWLKSFGIYEREDILDIMGNKICPTCKNRAIF